MIGSCLVPFLHLMINGEGDIHDLYGPYSLFVVDAAISYLLIYRVVILRADQRGYIVTSYELGINIVRVIAQIVVLFVTGSYFLYLAIKVLGTLATNVVSTLRARKDYPFALNATESLTAQERREIVRTIGAGFLYRVSAVLLNSTTNIIISVMVSTIIVGYVANYTTIIVAVTSVIVILFSNLTPSIGNLAVLGTSAKRLEVFNIMVFVGSWLTVIFVGCTTLLSNDFIGLWIGSSYVLPDSTVMWKMLLMFFSCIMQPIFAYREAVGLYRQTKYVMVAAAVANLVLSIGLGYIWGLDGILAASLIACALTYFWYEPWVLFHMYFAGYPLAFFRNVLFALLGTGAFVAIGHLCLSWMTIDSWALFLLKGAILFIAGNAACFVVLRRCSEFAFVLDRASAVRRKFKSRGRTNEVEEGPHEGR